MRVMEAAQRPDRALADVAVADGGEPRQHLAGRRRHRLGRGQQPARAARRRRHQDVVAGARLQPRDHQSARTAGTRRDGAVQPPAVPGRGGAIHVEALPADFDGHLGRRQAGPGQLQRRRLHREHAEAGEPPEAGQASAADRAQRAVAAVAGGPAGATGQAGKTPRARRRQPGCPCAGLSRRRRQRVLDSSAWEANLDAPAPAIDINPTKGLEERRGGFHAAWVVDHSLRPPRSAEPGRRRWYRCITGSPAFFVHLSRSQRLKCTNYAWRRAKDAAGGLSGPPRPRPQPRPRPAG